MKLKKRVILLAGPTASGKSKLAVKIAKYLVKKGKRVIIKDNSTNLLEVKKEYGNMFIYQKKDV